jgi:hypothetical protein
MQLYAVAIAVHVLVAVLGIGLVGAIPVTAQVGLLVMLLTGVLIDLSVAGAFHRTGWFKASIALFVVVGVSLGRARAALRPALAPGGVRRDAFGRVERWGWAMCASVALVTLLMQTKLLP